jgi:hypothetical protein
MSVLLVSDDPELSAALSSALSRDGQEVVLGKAAAEPEDFQIAADQVGADVTAVVVALAAPAQARTGAGPAAEALGWEQVLAEHRVVPDLLIRHAAWTRAAALVGARAVHVVPAHSAALASTAQAVTQLTRSGNATPLEPALLAYTVAVESRADLGPAADLVSRLAWADDTAALAGAELVVGAGWLGLRGHPAPVATVSFGGPDLPDWVDEVLQRLASE